MSFFDLAIAIVMCVATLICAVVLLVLTVACGPLFWLPWLIIWQVFRKCNVPGPRTVYRHVKEHHRTSSTARNMHETRVRAEQMAQFWSDALRAEEGLSCRHERQVSIPHDGSRPYLDRCYVCQPANSLEDPSAFI